MRSRPGRYRSGPGIVPNVRMAQRMALRIVIVNRRVARRRRIQMFKRFSYGDGGRTVFLNHAFAVLFYHFR